MSAAEVTVAGTRTRDYLAEARKATSRVQVRELWYAARDAGDLTSELEARLAAIGRAIQLEGPPGLELFNLIVRDWLITGDYTDDELGTLWDWCQDAAIMAGAVHMIERGELWIGVEAEPDYPECPDVILRLRQRTDPRPRRGAR